MNHFIFHALPQPHAAFIVEKDRLNDKKRVGNGMREIKNRRMRAKDNKSHLSMPINAYQYG